MHSVVNKQKKSISAVNTCSLKFEHKQIESVAHLRLDKVYEIVAGIGFFGRRILRDFFDFRLSEYTTLTHTQSKTANKQKVKILSCLFALLWRLDCVVVVVIDAFDSHRLIYGCGVWFIWLPRVIVFFKVKIAFFSFNFLQNAIYLFISAVFMLDSRRVETAVFLVWSFALCFSAYDDFAEWFQLIFNFTLTKR